jgi:hypothetical protein
VAARRPRSCAINRSTGSLLPEADFDRNRCSGCRGV